MALYSNNGSSFGGGNDDILNILINKYKQNQNVANQNMSNGTPGQSFIPGATSGGQASGGGKGLSGLTGGAGDLLGGLSSMGSFLNQGVNATQTPEFNYAADNATPDQAAAYAKQKDVSAITGAFGKIPIIGGIISGIASIFGGNKAAAEARDREQRIVTSRNQHTQNLQDFQMNKIKENNFLKSSDLYKNMFDQGNNNNDNNNNNTFL